jgi:hypothetical protein
MHRRENLKAIHSRFFQWMRGCSPELLILYCLANSQQPKKKYTATGQQDGASLIQHHPTHLPPSSSLFLRYSLTHMALCPSHPAVKWFTAVVQPTRSSTGSSHTSYTATGCRFPANTTSPIGRIQHCVRRVAQTPPAPN